MCEGTADAYHQAMGAYALLGFSIPNAQNPRSPRNIMAIAGLGWCVALRDNAPYV
jgi:hypothetical protein